jgi:hypothetical protein
MQTIRQTNNRARWIIFIFVLLATELYSINALAQRSSRGNSSFSFYNPPKRFFVGFEALAGTRTFTLYSDHAQFNELSTLQEGKTIGGVIGGNGILFKVRHGAYKSDQNVELNENTFAINVAPLQFTRKKPKYFEPYVILDINVNDILLYGNPLPKPIAIQQGPPACACNCPCCEDGLHMSDMPGDPDLMEPEFTEGGLPVYVGTIKSVRTSVGLGVVLNLTSKKTFAKLFFEGKYGTEINGTTTTLALRDTRPSDQITVNAGIIVGLNLAGLSRR